jgi:RNA polymerase sigma-70 factor, ECF subfamily
LMLERLSPEERAAFTLREAFGAPYSDIATMLDKTEPTIRQIVSRARAKMEAQTAAPRTPPQRHLELLNAFVAAVVSGDIEAVKAVLAADVRLITDGGGRRSAALRVVEGRSEAAKLMHFLAGRGAPQRDVRVLFLNGAPGLLVTDDRGDPFAVQIAVSETGIEAVYVFRNPEKLAHLY